jgi:hypothetical protein
MVYDDPTLIPPGTTVEEVVVQEEESKSLLGFISFMFYHEEAQISEKADARASEISMREEGLTSSPANEGDLNYIQRDDQPNGSADLISYSLQGGESSGAEALLIQDRESAVDTNNADSATVATTGDEMNDNTSDGLVLTGKPEDSRQNPPALSSPVEPGSTEGDRANPRNDEPYINEIDRVDSPTEPTQANWESASFPLKDGTECQSFAERTSPLEETSSHDKPSNDQIHEGELNYIQRDDQPNGSADLISHSLQGVESSGTEPSFIQGRESAVDTNNADSATVATTVDETNVNTSDGLVLSGIPEESRQNPSELCSPVEPGSTEGDRVNPQNNEPYINEINRVDSPTEPTQANWESASFPRKDGTECQSFAERTAPFENTSSHSKPSNEQMKSVRDLVDTGAHPVDFDEAGIKATPEPEASSSRQELNHQDIAVIAVSLTVEDKNGKVSKRGEDLDNFKLVLEAESSTAEASGRGSSPFGSSYRLDYQSTNEHCIVCGRRGLTVHSSKARARTCDPIFQP